VSAHHAFWLAGGLLGLVTAALVLRSRRALNGRAVVSLVAAGVGVAAGAKWQYRLEYLPVSSAFFFSPREFITEPGVRLPLGLVTGAVVGLVCCLALRVSWRAMGDALCLGATVMMPVGRIGCLVAGCCTGRACPSWLGPLCFRYPAGTEAYDAQVRAGLLPVTSALSLPAHPLPVYFMLASLALLPILLRLRRARAGSILLLFCIVNPLTKLCLEPLRASPHPGPLMVAIPAVVLTMGLFAALRAWRTDARDYEPADTPVGIRA